jgi:endonuclease/exonuclease/phosphatase family metal-dependent hydrolase
MRVLTYNICGRRARRDPEHIQRIAAVIRALAPDVAGLQEVYQGGVDDPHGDQPALLGALTGMTPVFWPHLYLRGSAYGNAILARGKVGKPLMYRLPHRLLQLRALLETRVEVEGTAVDFFCTHLVHFGPLMARPRGRQLAAIARRLSDRHHPRVLVGDLNSGWGGLDIDALARAGLQAVCNEEHRTYPAVRPRYSFDHIFASREFRCARVWTVPTPASDHRPLVAELSPVGDRQSPGRGERRPGAVVPDAARPGVRAESPPWPSRSTQ